MTTISQMMWNTMSSNSSAIVSFATAMMKMKTLPTGFPVALCSTAIRVFRSTKQSKLSPPSNCWSCRWRCCSSGRIGLRDCRVSAKCASCSFRHCFNAAANSGCCRRGFWGPPPFKWRIQCCTVVSFKSDAIEKHNFLYANIVLRNDFR